MTEQAVNQYRPTTVSPPGVTIADLLEEKGIRQNELATRMGVSAKFVNEIVSGKAVITPATALALERALGAPASFWLTREAHYQESKARTVEYAVMEASVPWLKDIPHRDMLKFGWIRDCPTKAALVGECLNFFGVASTSAWQAQYVEATSAAAYRMSSRVAAHHGAVAAWLREGERQGARMECAEFDRERLLEAIGWSRSLTLIDEPSEFVPPLTERFANCGVAVVIVRAPKYCPVSGAVRWLTPNRALIQLSFKYLRNDNFWFTFFHECGHILLHSKKLLFLEGAEIDGQDEKEADKFAADNLIPPDEWATFEPLKLSEAVIRDFASRIGVAPGIVLGRLQNEERLPWSSLNHIKVKYQWADD